MSYAPAFTFTCDEPGCCQRHTCDVASVWAAVPLLRAAGWAVTRSRNRYHCPQHKRTTAQAAAAAHRAYSAIRAGRVEDYAELRSWGLTRREAAARVGVNVRTTWRYDADLRQRQQVAA
jgi:hypothetical protein